MNRTLINTSRRRELPGDEPGSVPAGLVESTVADVARAEKLYCERGERVTAEAIRACRGYPV